MKHLIRVYLKPFNDAGEYVTSWTDVSQYVDLNSLAAIAQNLDNTEYDIGVYRNSNFKIVFNNESGKFSDVGNNTSIFAFTRSNTLVKVTWEQGYDPECGVVVCGEAVLTEEVELFQGLLNDEASEMSLENQKISFAVLGKEAIFQKCIVPFSSLSNGDNLSDIVYAILNQLKITSILTLDVLNITLGNDVATDTVAWFENKTVQEALHSILLASNSVLYIIDSTIYITSRDPSAAFQYYFYGQASASGAENIVMIDKIKNGLSRVFNFFSWANVSTNATDTDSTVKYGARKKELDFEYITTPATRESVLNALLAEFAFPKQEFDLETPLNHNSLLVNLLDKVSIDYPTVYTESSVPICGIAVCGADFLPHAKWAFTVDPLDEWKVIGRSIDLKKCTITYRIRAV